METPEILQGIPDLEQTYRSVDLQILQLKSAIERLDEDLFFENMSLNQVKRWETMLNLTPEQHASLAERRKAVQSRVADALPYSFRVLKNTILAIEPNADIIREYRRLKVYIPRNRLYIMEIIQDLLERKLPLDMSYVLSLSYNKYSQLTRFTHGEMYNNGWTHNMLREIDIPH